MGRSLSAEVRQWLSLQRQCQFLHPFQCLIPHLFLRDAVGQKDVADHLWRDAEGHLSKGGMHRLWRDVEGHQWRDW
jgi:hypothetical protein